jgi:lipid-A-disaccharide synthase
MLAKRLVRLPNFSLVNIVAGKRIIPELLQDDVNGQSIARAAEELLEPSTYAAVLDELAQVRERLGKPGASARAADKIATLLKARGAGTT